MIRSMICVFSDLLLRRILRRGYSFTVAFWKLACLPQAHPTLTDRRASRAYVTCQADIFNLSSPELLRSIIRIVESLATFLDRLFLATLVWETRRQTSTLRTNQLLEDVVDVVELIRN